MGSMITDPDGNGNDLCRRNSPVGAGRGELTLKECASYYPILAIFRSLICS